MANIANLAVQLTASTASFTKSMSAAAKHLGVIKTAGNSVSSVLSGMGGVALKATAVVAAGATAAGAAFLVMAKHQAEAIDETSKLSERLQIGTRDLAAMQMQAQLSGVSTEQLTKGLEIYSRKLGEANSGNREARASFERLGLSADKLTQMGTSDGLGAIADRINRLPNAYAKAAAAQEIFGKSGQGLLNLLKDGSAGMEEAREKAERYGLAFSELDGKKIEEMNDSLDETKMVLQGVVNNYLIRMSPLITEAANAFINWATEGTRATDTFNTGFEYFAKTVQTAKEGMIALRMVGNLFVGAFMFGVSLISAAIDTMMIGITKAVNGLIKVNNALNPLKKFNPIENWDYSNTKLLSDYGATFIDDATAARKELEKEVAKSMANPNGMQSDLAGAANKILAGANSRAAESLQKSNGGIEDFLMSDDMEKATKAAQKVFDDTRTPFEKFNAETAELDDLLSKGLISWDTYTRGISKAGEELNKTAKQQDKMNKAQRAQDFGQFTALTMVPNDASGRFQSVASGGIKPVSINPTNITPISHRRVGNDMRMERVGDVGGRNEDTRILQQINERIGQLLNVNRKSAGLAYAG